MSDKTQEFLQKLAPCIERGDLDACVGEAARVAREMGIGAGELLELHVNEGIEKNKNTLSYILALAAAKGLSGEDKSRAYLGAAFAAQSDEKFEIAEKYYQKALEISPKNSGIYFLHALLLHTQKRPEAKEQYEIAIKYDPNNAIAHLFYSFLLIEINKIEESRKDFEKASKIINDLKLYSFRAIIFQKYSDFYNDIQNYKESSKCAAIAGDEYLKAAETSNESNKNKLIFQGNILKAKSYIRKIPDHSLYKSFLYKLGKNLNISELIYNLRNAAFYYEKASMCPVDEKSEICNACNLAISVFSNVLNALDAFIKGQNPPLNKKAWLNSLKQSREIYVANKLNNGVALVDTLEQLIYCIDELSNQKASGADIQDYLIKCYENLIEVSKNLDGALKVITYHSVDIIKEYLNKQGIHVGEEPKKSFLSIWGSEIRAAFITIIITAIVNQIFSLNLFSGLFNMMKSFILGSDAP